MNKSKFLKKSLAMLLALMLVVAMIPLSASAAPEDYLEYILVNDNTVVVDGGTLGVDDLKDDIKVALANGLTADYELRAIPNNSAVNYTALDTTAKTLAAKDYIAKDGTVKFALYDTKLTPNAKVKDYTITLTEVEKNTSTDIRVVDTHKGVYSVDVDNDKHELNVVLARHNWNLNGSVAYQEDLNAFITVEGLNGAAVETDTEEDMKGAQVQVDNEDTFVVRAQNGSAKTWHVYATYLDALDSFSLNEYKGDILNLVNKDDNIVDTILVTLPSSALYDEDNWGDLIEEFDVDYEVNGDVHCTVDVDYEKADIKKLADGDKDVLEGTVTVERLDGAVQKYTLKVQLEKSDSTELTYARFDRTVGVADADAKTITVALPQNISTGTPPAETDMKNVDVVLYSDATVGKITITDINDTTGKAEVKTMVELDEDATDVEGLPAGGKAWKLDDVNLEGSENNPRIVTVYAQDGVTYKSYKMSATWADRVDDAKLTSFYLMDGDGNSYGVKNVTGKTVTVEVPYMTLDVKDWTVLAKASNNAKVQELSTGVPYDVVSGLHKGSDIGLTGTMNANNGYQLKTTLRVVDKFDDTRVFEEYTVKVVLKAPVEGNTITNLRFTAQPTTELSYNDPSADPRGDKEFFRAIKRDVNEFGAEVITTTDGNHEVGTINLPVPQALQSNAECDYTNVITGITPVGGARVYILGDNPNEWRPVNVLSNDDSDKLNASTIDNQIHNKVLVMPEEVARWAILESEKKSGENYYHEGYINIGKDLLSAEVANGLTVADFSTLYTVDIKKAGYSSANTLYSFSVGDSELNVGDGKITGSLAWGVTAENKRETGKVTFAEFELDKYAVLASIKEGLEDVYFYSNGDIDGDGTVDETTGSELKNEVKSNRQFLFVRNDDEDKTVSVFRANEAGVYEPIEGVYVLAEDRLEPGNEGSKNYYQFDLTWAEPETEADILTFKLDGYTGTVDNSDRFNRTITVKNVPYGTDLTGMIAEFTTTPNAKVYLTNPDGVLLESGVTSINYTNPVLLYVESEDTKNSNSYTVTIDMGLTFSDIDEDDWFYDDVVAAANEGYVEGMGDGKYEPKGSLTRAQFATMIARAMNYEDKPASPAAFTDVNGHWAADAINFCAENGIVDGYEDCTFKPDRAVTRQEVAAMLTRAFDLVEVSDDKYPDDASISGWASEYVYKCLAAGLMKGDKDTGNFRPASILNRAEAATILMNANREGIID